MDETMPIYLHELHPMKQVAILEECLSDPVLKDAIESEVQIIVGYYIMHPKTDTQVVRGE
jgi:hypothetical protein